MNTRLVGLTVVLLAACVDVAPDPATDVSGTYTGQAEIHRTANATARTDTATYTLRVADRSGFMHGLWTIRGDTAQPSDPWEAVVTGDYATATKRMVLEYHSPVTGRCHLAGKLESNTYRPEYRCADNWTRADTLCLTRTGSTFNPCAPPTSSNTWMGLTVRAEGSRTGYDRDDYGSSSRWAKWEDEIIASLPKSGGRVYTPYTCTLYDVRADGTASTDVDHIVALAEAHDSGIPASKRRDLAADTLNLTVAVPRVNRTDKGDRDAGEWRPAKNRGWYAARIVAVKRKYGLSVDEAERDALAAMLAGDASRKVTCP